MAADADSGALTPAPPRVTASFERVEDLYAVLAPVMQAVAAAVGDHCEVALHDLTTGDLDHTIFAIINGHVTGRTVGGPSTNLGLEVARDDRANHDEYGYAGRTSDGRELHCSSVYYRNAEGRIIASLCVNIDLTALQTAKNIIGALLPAPAPEREFHTVSISSLLETMIADAVSRVGKPVALMDRAERIEVLRVLDERGAFHVKHSVETVATRLGISKVTAYAYLDQARGS